MYVNLLTKIKNSQNAGHATVKFPFSKMDLAVAEALARAGFLKNVAIKGKTVKRIIEMDINEEKVIRGIKFISRPSRRIYAGYRELWPVKSGYGISVISTPKGGIVDDREARKLKAGGQILFEIW